MGKVCAHPGGQGSCSLAELGWVIREVDAGAQSVDVPVVLRQVHRTAGASAARAGRLDEAVLT